MLTTDKEIISKVEVDYIFMSGIIEDVDSEYFIKRIDEGVSENNNLSFRTNVKGFHTNFHYFNNDKKFMVILSRILNQLDTLKYKFRPFSLREAWGIKLGLSNYTQIHDHCSQYLSGVLYLNDSKQELIFPAIDQKVKPVKGRFVVFSSFLEHHTYRNLEDEYKYAIPFNWQPKGILD
jgi:hypothetical protein|tara:strand:+ start:2870 stop:3403 length:534 start_codon:yes stop_codon:yes gene_type:complete